MVPWLFPRALKTKIEEYVLSKDLPTPKWCIHSLSFNGSRDHQGLILWMKALLSGHRWGYITCFKMFTSLTHTDQSFEAPNGYHPGIIHYGKWKHNQLLIKWRKSYSMFWSMIHHRKHHMPILNIRLLGWLITNIVFGWDMEGWRSSWGQSLDGPDHPSSMIVEGRFEMPKIRSCHVNLGLVWESWEPPVLHFFWNKHWRSQIMLILYLLSYDILFQCGDFLTTFSCE